MNHWHCANAKRKRARHRAKVEPYLGDIVGEALLPVRTVYGRRAGWRLELGVVLVLYGTGFVVMTAFIITLLAMLFWYYPASPFWVG